ncbi:Uncharacterized membrane protein YeiH [Lachnospiraceae bacterium]|nr:Uncharacterized membrane protein YeiH [Lachnospiraceae bacterium]
MNMSGLIFAMEMIGVIAFAISGVFVAKEKHMDYFGAVVLGCATACGGGVVRDLILGVTPPAMFRDPIYVIAAFITATLVFILEYKKVQLPAEDSWILNVADSIGLGVFVVVGSQAAIYEGFQDKFFLCVFVGTVTGVGGGILRDILACQMPMVMRKHVYALAAILGAVVYCIIESTGYEVAASLSGIAVVVLIRMLATIYRWNLPAFKE